MLFFVGDVVVVLAQLARHLFVFFSKTVFSRVIAAVVVIAGAVAVAVVVAAGAAAAVACKSAA